MNNIGRLAFPIFAFLIVEGFFYTSNFNQYVKRLLLFAFISEIPFDLVYGSRIVYPFHQNIMFTLLLGLLCINEIEKFKKDKTLKKAIIMGLKVILFFLIGLAGFVDYGVMGIITIIVFYIFRNLKFGRIGELISLIMLNIVWFEGQMLPLLIFGREYYFPLQGISVLALVLIWLYNGKKGKKSKALQYGMYAFYPVHLLILYLIRYYIV